MKTLVRISIAAIMTVAMATLGGSYNDAWAQGDQTTVNQPAKANNAAKKKAKKKTSEALGPRPLKRLDFEEGSTIDGNTHRPSGEDVTARRETSHTNLIRVREHFLPEIHKSVENL